MAIQFNSLQNILIVADYSDFIINEEADRQSLLNLSYLICQFKNLKKEVSLLCYNKSSRQNLNVFWKTGSATNAFFEGLRLCTDRETLGTRNYDMVLFTCAAENFLVPRSAEPLSGKSWYLLDDHLGNGSDLLPHANGDLNKWFRAFSAPDLAALKRFQATALYDFQGLGIVRQNSLRKSDLLNLATNNRSILKRAPVKIIFLDDFYRKFFIGDSTFWLYELKLVLSDLNWQSSITVNIQNYRKHDLISGIFKDFDNGHLKLTNRRWTEVNFHEFDLVLCHPDTFLKFIDFTLSNKRTFANIKIYRFSTQKRDFDLDYIDYPHLRNSFRDPKDAITRIKTQKHNYLKGLKVSEQELNIANNWFISKGLKTGEKIVVLPDESSDNSKNLKPQVYFELLKWILSDIATKILVFDPERKNKAQAFRQKLGKDYEGRIIVSSGSIRHTMQLLTSKYISAVISPCTGVIHLANGLYTYLLNEKSVGKAEIPTLIVYTGKNLFSDHPNFWYGNTLVKCGVFCKLNEGDVRIVDLTSVPRETSEYHSITAPVSSIMFKDLVEFISSIQKPD